MKEKTATEDSKPTKPRRAKPGAVIEPDEFPPTNEEMFEAGYYTEREYLESRAMHDVYAGMPASTRPPWVTLREMRHDPRFQRRLAEYTRTSSAPRRGPRARGAGSPAVRRSGHDRGSPDDDSSSDEAEPPPAGRLYEPCRCGCGANVSHLRRGAKYLDGTHRQRGMRARDRANPDQVAERSAARQRANGGVWTLLCDCDPTPELNDAGQCTHCGHPRSADAIDWLDDPPPPSRSFVVAGSPKRDRWKTRPNRSDAARLRKTRREFVDESIIRGAAA